MSSSERLSPLLKKEASPAVLRERQFWRCSGGFKCLELSGLGIPAELSRGIPGKALRAFLGSFWNLSGISSGKSQLHLLENEENAIPYRICSQVFSG